MEKEYITCEMRFVSVRLFARSKQHEVKFYSTGTIFIDEFTNHIYTHIPRNPVMLKIDGEVENSNISTTTKNTYFIGTISCAITCLYLSLLVDYFVAGVRFFCFCF